jgi:phage anti-repressor protein
MSDLATRLPLQLRPIDGEEVRSVDARRLHQALGVQKHFTQWFAQQVERLGLVEGQDYGRIFSTPEGKNPRGGRPRADFWFTANAGKHVAMVSDTAEAFGVRQYFIDVERDSRRRSNALAVADSMQSAFAVYREATTFVRDIPELKAAMKDLIDVTTFRLKTKRQRVVGLVRRMIRRSSEHQATIEQLGWVRTVLEETSRMIAVERQLRARGSDPADPRQRRLFEN